MEQNKHLKILKNLANHIVNIKAYIPVASTTFYLSLKMSKIASKIAISKTKVVIRTLVLVFIE